MASVASKGGPTPRRSARLSAAGSATGGSAAPSAVASTTPARRQGLPKVSARQSRAYGASGRLVAAGEIAVQTTGFTQAFEAQRGTARDRDERPVMNGSAGSHSRSASAASIPHSPASSLPDFEFTSPSRQTPSQMDTSKSFGMIHEAGMTYQEPPTYSTQRPRQNTQQFTHVQASSSRVPIEEIRERIALRRMLAQEAQEAQQNEEINSEPQWYQHMSATAADAFTTLVNLCRKIPKNFALSAAFMLITLLIAVALSGFGTPSSQSPHYTPNVSNAITRRIAYSWDQIVRWVEPPKKLTDEERERRIREGDYDIIRDLLLNMDEKHDAQLTVVKDSVRQLQQHLPTKIVVSRQDDGSIQISNEFWKALYSKIQSEGLGSGSNSQDVNWLEFWSKNEDRIRELVNDSATSTTARTIVTQPEFLNAVERTYMNLLDRVDKRIVERIEPLRKEIEVKVNKEAKKLVVDQIRLESLALTNMMANTEINLRKVNYFSPGLGARIDPYGTSTTFSEQQHFFNRMVRRWTRMPDRRPPIAALEDWSEPGDCWCAAPDIEHKGHAQLTVNLFTPMFPTQITIEHAAMAMMPYQDISNAPREIELWAQTDQPAKSRFGTSKICESSGPEGWACLGKVRYDIHGSNHIQTFSLDAESSAPVTKAMVRVLNNHGAPYTCIYRVRLHGQDHGSPFEYKLNE